MRWEPDVTKPPGVDDLVIGRTKNRVSWACWVYWIESRHFSRAQCISDVAVWPILVEVCLSSMLQLLQARKLQHANVYLVTIQSCTKLQQRPERKLKTNLCVLHTRFSGINLKALLTVDCCADCTHPISY